MDTTDDVVYFEMERLGDQDKLAAENGEKQKSKQQKRRGDKGTLEEVLRRPVEDYDLDDSVPHSWSERHSIKNLVSPKGKVQTRESRKTARTKSSRTKTNTSDDSSHKESDLSAFSKLKGLKKSLHDSADEMDTFTSFTGSLKSKIRPTGIPEFDIPEVDPLHHVAIGLESQPKTFEKRSQQLTKKTARKMRKSHKGANFLALKEDEPINNVRTATDFLINF